MQLNGINNLMSSKCILLTSIKYNSAIFMDHLCCRVFHVLYDPALCLAGFSESAP